MEVKYLKCGTLVSRGSLRDHRLSDERCVLLRPMDRRTSGLRSAKVGVQLVPWNAVAKSAVMVKSHAVRAAAIRHSGRGSLRRQGYRDYVLLACAQVEECTDRQAS